ncbi:hypothetical protein [Klebsiella pneumoniae]|nr:hypothetical protein [Klebsiella pneumoniae]
MNAKYRETSRGGLAMKIVAAINLLARHASACRAIVLHNSFVNQ